MNSLIKEWTEKLKIKNSRQIFDPEYMKYSAFYVTTEIYKAPEEIRNNKDMCLIALLEADEYLWNIPKEIRNIDLYEELLEKGYKHDIFEAENHWPEESFEFLKKYKKQKSDGVNYFLKYYGVFANKEMVLELVKNRFFTDKRFLFEYYSKDKEVMCALLDYNPSYIVNVTKSIKNYYCKNFENIYKILKHDPKNYIYLPEKIKEKEEVIQLALSLSVEVFSVLPNNILNNKEKIIELINLYPEINGQHINYILRDDYDIAKLLIERNGKNFKYFNFKDNDELLRLSLLTYNYLFNIPAEKEYKDLMIKVLSLSTKENNSFYFSNTTFDNKFDFIKDFLLTLMKSGEISEKEVSNYLSCNLKVEKDRELLKEVIKCYPKTYYFFRDSLKDDDIEMAHVYLSSYEKKYNGIESAEQRINYSIRRRATEAGVSIKNYVLSEYLKNNLQQQPKVKQLKL